MNHDFSIIELVLNASWVVQLVLLLLIGVSVMSWAVIFMKWGSLSRIKRQNRGFEENFWSGASLSDLHEAASGNVRRTGPMERVFVNGMAEYYKLRERKVNDLEGMLGGSRRAMRASMQRELDTAESWLSFLGSVASVSPYIGLFGTVWGIMHAFTGLASMEQVSLATVAPGIAEALVATAIGLFAAIPAVLAYNRFAREVDRIAMSMESFIEEFSNILHRNIAVNLVSAQSLQAQQHGSYGKAAASSSQSSQSPSSRL